MVTLLGHNLLRSITKTRNQLKLFSTNDITETTKDYWFLAILSSYSIFSLTPGYSIQGVMQPCKALIVYFCAPAASKTPELHCHSLCKLDCNLFHTPWFTIFAPSVFANNLQAMFLNLSGSGTKSDYSLSLTQKANNNFQSSATFNQKSIMLCFNSFLESVDKINTWQFFTGQTF